MAERSGSLTFLWGVGSRESGVGNTTFIYGGEFFSWDCPLPFALCPLPSALCLRQG
ncbi:MAG: hypothetical protein WA919_00405 [Coleofasciculaceae cyanobacterium]